MPPHTHALLATCCKHQPCLHCCRQRLWGQNDHLPMLLTTIFLKLWGPSHHSWFPQGKLQLYPDLKHPRGRISHVHSTASKYPFHSCSNNALGVQNVHQTTESFTWASLSSSAVKTKENLLALWIRVRWMEKGLLPIMKLRSPYKEKSRTDLTKQVHDRETLFLYTDETGSISNQRNTLTSELTQKIVSECQGEE